MSNFKYETIQIGNKVMDRLIDEDGVNWYPLGAFLRIILVRHEKVQPYRDSLFIRYMKIFEYQSKTLHMMCPIKTWCINDLGVKYLLRHSHVKNVGNKHLYQARLRGYYEACLFFDVKPPVSIDTTFIYEPPKLDEYDIWSVMCIENDFGVQRGTRWKICPKCNYYYPYKEAYFGAKTKKSRPCLQCQGRDFKCKNKVIQFIYDNGGLDLLYKIRNMDTDESIVKTLKIFINRGGVEYNED